MFIRHSHEACPLEVGERESILILKLKTNEYPDKSGYDVAICFSLEPATPRILESLFLCLFLKSCTLHLAPCAMRLFFIHTSTPYSVCSCHRLYSRFVNHAITSAINLKQDKLGIINNGLNLYANRSASVALRIWQ